MNVGIDETRQNRLAAKVYEAGCSRFQAKDLAIAAHSYNAPSADRDGLRDGKLRVHSDNFGIMQDDLWWLGEEPATSQQDASSPEWERSRKSQNHKGSVGTQEGLPPCAKIRTRGRLQLQRFRNLIRRRGELANLSTIYDRSSGTSSRSNTLRNLLLSPPAKIGRARLLPGNPR
jgi:hypothetical protein